MDTSKQSDKSKQTVQEKVPDGIVYSTGLTRGKYHGESTQTYKGVVIRRKFYKNGLKHGESSKWTTGGIPIKTTTFHEGEKTGTMILYHEDGQVKSSCHLKNGKKHTIFEKGVLVTGLYEAWYKSGILAETSMWFEGKKEGDKTVYYLNGTIKSKADYMADRLHGRYRQYDCDGDIVSDKVYMCGNFIG